MIAADNPAEQLITDQ